MTAPKLHFPRPEGTAEISRWPAPRRHRYIRPITPSAPEVAAEGFNIRPCSRTPAGVHDIIERVPGAALRLPPAKFRCPSGTGNLCRVAAVSQPGGLPEISRWQAQRRHRFNRPITPSAPEAAAEQLVDTI